ncbi:MAG: Formamidopyrimidine-DNA glycosylase [Parcubacteria group bacterium GW2011_GWC1_43_11b]|uniref:Formamidopyrimidine-DNA glycosylase n=1 Tax=Candidatus Vogelbacteria bacterium RIFOXYB1_FULL_42_16 TaxID=1802436 RepID=A0A1G2QBT2_9BACT|nr:MAG: Formamidopyrimidine-DNA glycosylase [Parcubacteria group bacterium GW2011_GWC1_43_11b]OHA58020.1 MAG: DNA-formamidopyrimidine glycosylase [Candidatus Vogelbacteria bacterium RIFOXYB1_FULL_42_16]
MPELPEVETIKRDLAKVLIGRQISKVEILWAKTVAPLSPAIFQRKIAGTKITDLERRAKMIRIKLSGPLDLLIHLKMTGQLIFQPQRGQAVAGGHPQPGGLDNLPNKFTRLVFHFSDGSKLFFNDMRKFGWVRLADDQTIAKLFAEHGPEPLTKNFSLKYFQSILAKYPRRPIKQILLDQKLIAGIGNIYADESCFLAKILPTRLAGKISATKTKKLHQAIITVLKLSISKKGTSSRNYVRGDGSQGGFIPHLYVYGRAGEPCKICGQRIKKLKLVGRGTHFCDHCQK